MTSKQVPRDAQAPSDNHPEKTITLLRHGLSTANYDRIAQGQMDYPLHPHGIEQVERLVDYWQNVHQTFDQIISSPLLRAKETARIIGSTLSVAVDEDPLWLEHNFGEGEGLAYDQIEERLSSDRVRWSNFKPLFAHGESEHDLDQRASAGIQAILQRKASNILLVSHGGILNAALRSMLGIRLSREGIRPPGFRFDNTGFSRAIFDIDPARWIIQFHNATPHLE